MGPPLYHLADQTPPKGLDLRVRLRARRSKRLQIGGGLAGLGPSQRMTWAAVQLGNRGRWIPRAGLVLLTRYLGHRR